MRLWGYKVMRLWGYRVMRDEVMRDEVMRLYSYCLKGIKPVAPQIVTL